MKRLALAALCIWAAPALAADPAEVIPVEPGFTWTGAYIGLHVGGAWGDKDWAFTDGLGGPIIPPTTTSHSVTGFIGGAQVGYNWQFDRVVAGAEAEISWANIDGDSICPNPEAVCSTEIRWIGSATARLGMAMNRFLIYGKGGVAFADDSYFATFFTDPLFVDDSSAGGTRVGWTIGAGGEYAINDKWSAKLEYMFADFGSDTEDFTFNVDGIFASTADIEQQLHTVKFGINYHF
jgi:outer membrane immunogenic protein